MRAIVSVFITLCFLHSCSPSKHLPPSETPVTSAFAIAIHGGAGVISRAKLTAEKEALYRASLHRALALGYAILDSGGTALDAVTAVVMDLEEDSLFNAGKGAVLTYEGTAELDAAIMSGLDLRAGAVAGIRTVKHPVALARAVMEQSPHVMMIGTGAEAFAAEMGLERVPNEYFILPSRRRALLLQKQSGTSTNPNDLRRNEKYGTVGAVALDRSGNLAAATSTGGMSNKRWGRVGDAPLIGAGTYADNESCAVSATGWGEYFIRVGVAKAIAEAIRYNRCAPDSAARLVLEKVKTLGGDGGVIVLDRYGRVATPFNSEGMYRGIWRSGEASRVAIFGDEN